MAIDSDINSSADSNSYSAEQLAELQKSALGETAREFTLNTELTLFVIAFIVIVSVISVFIFMLTKN